MRRRFLLPLALSVCPLLTPPAWAQPASADAQADDAPDDAPQTQPRFKVSAAQLQTAVAQRFPLRYPVAGLLNLDVQVPSLRLQPALNRLGALMVVEAAGPALKQRHQGTLEVEFALRYEPADRTVRAHQVRLVSLAFPSLQPSVVAMLNLYGPALTERALLEVVLHTLRPQDLALPEAIGMQPGSITVTNEGLTIGFVPKPLF